MKWVHEVDPSTDTYRNAPADMARVAHMVHKMAGSEMERDALIGMLFAAPRNRVKA